MELGDREIIKITFQLLKGLKYLVSSNVRFSKLSFDNIQLDNNFNIKICEFR
jgi:serine/threonine protein kinase